MFQQLANLWECHRDHKNNRGAMCISPDRVLYFADCNDNIYSYNLRDNVLQKIYTHDYAIAYIYWANQRLCIVDTRYNLCYKLRHLTRKNKWCIDSTMPHNCNPPDTYYYIWNDSNYNVYRQDRRFFCRFENGEFKPLWHEHFPIILRPTKGRSLLTYFDPNIGEWVCCKTVKYVARHIILARQSERVFYIRSTTIRPEHYLIRLTLPHTKHDKIKQEVLSANLPIMSCVDPVSGEIYAIEHREGQASLYVYIYPLKTLMNLCVDVIAKSPLLCQTVPLLPGDLRVRFTYLHYYNN